MKGLHLTADLRGCQGNLAAMVEPAAMRRLCLAAVEAAGLTPVGELFHPFPAPGGVTGVVLLAESHLTVHAWPEHQAVTLDVYVCNVGTDNSARAEQVVAHLVDAFEPRGVERQRLQRGAVVTRGWRRSTA